jgi:hypothetical protein
MLLGDLANGRDGETSLATRFGRIELGHWKTLPRLGRVA